VGTNANPNSRVRLYPCGLYHERDTQCRGCEEGRKALLSASPASPLYSCGRCPSGLHSADMTRMEAYKHAALVHNAVVRGPLGMAVRA